MHFMAGLNGWRRPERDEQAAYLRALKIAIEVVLPMIEALDVENIEDTGGVALYKRAVFEALVRDAAMRDVPSSALISSMQDVYRAADGYVDTVVTLDDVTMGRPDKKIEALVKKLLR